MTKKVIDKHIKGYQTISKQLDVSVIVVVHIIQKFKIQGTVANLPEGGCTIFDDKLKIIRITNEPRTTSEEIKGLLQGQCSSVSDQIICYSLNQTRLHLRLSRRKDTSFENKSLKKMPNCILTSHNASGGMSHVQTRENCNILARRINSMLADAKTSSTSRLESVQSPMKSQDYQGREKCSVSEILPQLQVMGLATR